MGQPQNFSKGVIVSVREVSIKGTQSGVGAVAGAVAGGLAGSKVSGDQTISAIGGIGWGKSRGTNYAGQSLRVCYSTGCW